MIAITYENGTKVEVETFGDIIFPEFVKKINCSFCNITELPITNFVNLEVLYADNNRIKQMPKGLNLPKLIILSIIKNELESFPEDAKFLNLEYLDISKNKISKLPKNFCEGYPKLINFNMSLNLIKKLPKNFSFPALEQLYIQNNKLVCFPEKMEIPKLSFLYLNNNKIEKIPKINFPKLKELYLKNNKITKVEGKSYIPPGTCHVYLNGNNLINAIPLYILRTQWCI